MEMTTTTAIMEANYIILRLATKVWTINKRGAAIQKKKYKSSMDTILSCIRIKLKLKNCFSQHLEY